VLPFANVIGKFGANSPFWIPVSRELIEVMEVLLLLPLPVAVCEELVEVAYDSTEPVVSEE
jgi:hypothetical protein